MITIAFPFPPSTNTYWRSIGIGKNKVKICISKKGREYAAKVANIVASQKMPQQKGKLFARYDLYPPSNHDRDVDNFDSKAINDAMTKADLLEDDKQIRGKISWFHDEEVAKPGAIVVQLIDLEAVREIYERPSII